MLGTLITTAHLFIAVILIMIILLQQGKGADMGATFGGGGNTVFGAAGADSLLTKVTTITAILFMITSVILARSTAPTASPSEKGNLFKSPPAAAPAEETPASATTEELPAAEEAPAAATNNAVPMEAAPAAPAEQDAPAPAAGEQASSQSAGATAAPTTPVAETNQEPAS